MDITNWSEKERLAWAAGLFEGEGYITSHTYGDRKYHYPEIGIAQKDRQVLDIWIKIFGVGKIYKTDKENGNYIHHYKLSRTEEVIKIMEMLKPYLSDRRIKRYNEVLDLNTYKGGNESKTHCKHGHEYTEENTYVHKNPDGSLGPGGRNCRTCKNDRQREKRKKEREYAR